ncbi:DNA-binding LacI/PurR family transcriptional regulator [Arthrobacter silviterrae]|uniref:DeoR/GlpR family transcriptional regulator n=1 Tax=Arthrobacter silviterrae TaxID=2026658 RepID=A0ABX0DF34_9MICC|nr:LacI family DNA-binding transcriptional regulator [Arthrobacter silviterrae]MDQ0277014.1 DNA-binding LacI/PurR family transcriptional regulator [Arthrobacter silviterrae]NGN82802.1 DeoR/GlpR family transcriptional regulator [Arthrobacter silviterrae]
MLASGRHKYILEQLRLHGRVKATEIAQALAVSEITIRRDLNELHDGKQLSRVHGGAVRLGGTDPGSKRQILVGILVPGSVYYFPEVIKGMEMVAERLNVRLVLGVSGGMDAEPGHVRRMLDLGVEGMLITTVAGDDRAAEVGSWLGEMKVPAVLVERSFGYPHVGEELDYVRSDHAYGAALAIRHLHGLGHRSIAVALAPTPTSYWLEQGAAEAMDLLGLTAGLPMFQFPRVPAGVDLGAVERLLDDVLAHGITGIFVHNDTHASALVDAALARGVRVPEDLSVIAYDDVVANLAAVPLTAVGPPKHSVGALALEQLVRRLGYPADRQGAVVHLSLVPNLNVRRSTGAPATAK